MLKTAHRNLLSRPAVSRIIHRKCYKCKLTFFLTIQIFTGKQLGRLPEIDTASESLIDNDEVWDEGAATSTASNPFNEPVFETIRSSGTPSLRG